MNVLVTGGAGYIGSHTCVELLAAGHDVTVIDNLSNSKPEALRRVREIAGRDLAFHRVDLLDPAGLDAVFRGARFDAVIHFAGLKAVGESVAKPLWYYRNNVVGTLNLLDAMAAHDVRVLVFSSSATVYGAPHAVPITEDFPLQPTNPYGQTKFHIERILRDLHVADPAWRISLLRYFNPVGAHVSGRIGEDPRGVPNNLLPFVAQVAIGRLPEVRVFGTDWPTHDGTGVRDYIHVTDLAIGHLDALRHLASHSGVHTFNLGTGRGSSVLDVVEAFEAASGRPIPIRRVERRPGDVAACYADPARANRELGWHARFDLDRMCTDAWRWQSNNPQGFPDES